MFALSLNPMAQRTTTIVDHKYSRRLPTVLTVNRTLQLPAMLMELKMVMMKFASHGIPYAIKIWWM